jgi:hypothetical protein
MRMPIGMQLWHGCCFVPMGGLGGCVLIERGAFLRHFLRDGTALACCRDGREVYRYVGLVLGEDIRE